MKKVSNAYTYSNTASYHMIGYIITTGAMLRGHRYIK